MANCKGCGKWILSGDYCARCQEKRGKSRIKQVLGGLGALVAAVGGYAWVVAKKVAKKG